MNEKEYSKKLIDKYLDGKCSEREKLLVERFYMDQFIEKKLPEKEYLTTLKTEIWNKVSENTFADTSHRKQKALYYRIAAMILFIISAAAYLYFGRGPQQPPQQMAAKIIPGSNKAILILANGKKVILNESPDGQIAAGTGIKATKTNGQLVYAAAGAGGEDEVNAFNTVQAPKGGYYRVILTDGTKVWLNSGSSIRYPLAFQAKERKVELEGEGYFEVAHRAAQPFIVKTRDHMVRVLGTHFNINSYADEPASKTTLLEGAVQIGSEKGNRLLKPGQQAVIGKDQIDVVKADIEQVMAWKNGDFIFDGESLNVIMRQISRWYDVDVAYQGNIGDVQFGGSISRSKDITDVLKVLEVTGAVHFKITGRRIMVMR
ncbi:FecR family protein [Mucilaginibacter rubeus]|uniref:DUF4974 domain-containing protein n=1 Tax=Mucilaginibacter rubeus TaxID=2027860 RepID=A0A5C1I3I4_9SPHI|nr:FecR family protein [Mucilaginibacter rubeus]QEM11741.1 DUF4974 domain-containing protein [Mucilaginibacter rubeus]